MNIRLTHARTFTVLLLVFSFFATQASSQVLDFPSPGYKPWNSGPLTWGDFQQRHLPADTKKISDISILSSRTDFEKMKIGNTKFSYARVNIFMDRLLSWYDPDKADDWQLRYNQVIFDMAQLYALQCQIEYNRYYSPSRRPDYGYYNRLFVSRYMALEAESDQGRDSTVIKRYEDEVRNELEQVQQIEPSIPIEGEIRCGAGFYGLYLLQAPLGTASECFGPFQLGGMTFTFRTKEWFYDIDLGVGFGSTLKKSNFYHDPKKDYDWRQGIPTKNVFLTLNAGRQFFSTRYYRFIPYLGAGLTGLEQATEIPINQSRMEISEVLGLRLNAGINADWKMVHFLMDYEPSDLILRMKLFGAYDSFKGLGNFWSINLGIVIGADGCFIK